MSNFLLVKGTTIVLATEIKRLCLVVVKETEKFPLCFSFIGIEIKRCSLCKVNNSE